MSHPFSTIKSGADVTERAVRPRWWRRKKKPAKRAVASRSANSGNDGVSGDGVATTKPSSRPRRPASRGWAGRGGGASQYVQAPDMWRGTTVQVCGLWPFAIGTGSPMIGVPLGRHLHSGATVCCDPISWFQRAKLISNPKVAKCHEERQPSLSGFRNIAQMTSTLPPDRMG